MQTSLITYPQADRFIVIRRSILQACEGDRTAAALVSFFEYWHNYRNQQIEYTALMNEMLAVGQQPPILDTSGWQYHTDEQLERAVLISKVDTIRKSLDLLETDLRFISTDVPDRLKMLHKTGRTKWFLLMAGRINEWLADYAKSKSAALKPIPRRITARGLSKTLKGNVEVETVFNYRNRRRREYWHSRRKKAVDPKPSLKIYKLIEDRLLEGSSVLDLCMAVEGNLYSSWHQGNNDREKIYDSFDLVFRDSGKVGHFATIAVQAGIDPDQIEKAIESGGKPEPAKADLLSRALARRLAPLVIQDDWHKTATVSQLKEVVGDLELSEELNFTLIEQVVGEAVEGEVGMFTESHQSNLIDLVNLINETL